MDDVKRWRDEFARHDKITMLNNRFESNNKDETKSIVPHIIQETKQMLHLIIFFYLWT